MSIRPDTSPRTGRRLRGLLGLLMTTALVASACSDSPSQARQDGKNTYDQLSLPTYASKQIHIINLAETGRASVTINNDPRTIGHATLNGTILVNGTPMPLQSALEVYCLMTKNAHRIMAAGW